MKEKIIIVDAGSTKTSWALVEADAAPKIITTEGCNAAMMSSKECGALLSKALECLQVAGNDVDIIEYYGAGCATQEICDNLTETFASVCRKSQITVASDLVGAAKALFDCTPGIACILGTGSNSALYDGEKIVMNVPPLGYILGDEGSGASLGRRLVRDSLRGVLDTDLTEELARDFGVTKENVLQKVYREPGGNVFLASTVPFLSRHHDHELVRHILIEEFTAFFERNVDLYPECRDYRVGFVGSVALHFRRELEQVAKSMGYFTADIIKDPLTRLVENKLSKIK